MKNGLLLTTIGSLILPITAWASLHPLATLSIGADSPNTHLNQNITIISPYQNSYLSGGSNTQLMAGLFLGAETSLLTNLLGQLGVSYYSNNPYTIKGSVYQFADPTMNNLAYQYHIESQRFLIEAKILTTLQQQYHPYVTLGAGTAINKTYQYTETPVNTDDVPMSQGFTNRTYHSFAYQLGLGLEKDFTSHFRCGGGYRYINLGTAGLGTTPLQDGNQTIKFNHLHVNEFLLQLSYIG